MSPCCSKTIPRVLLKASLLWFMLLGLLQPKDKNLKRKNLFRCYCICVNTFMFALILEIALAMSTKVNDEKSLSNLIYMLNQNWASITVLVIIINLWIERFRHSELVFEAVKLKHDYFNSRNVENVFFARHVILRNIGFFTQLLAIVMSMLVSQSFNSLRFYVLLFKILMFQSVIFAIEAQYFYGILYISCCYDQLNKDLMTVRTKLNAIDPKKPISMQRSCDLAEEVDQMAVIYSKLLDLERRLTAVFKLPITLILFNCLSSNVVRSFSFLVYITAKFQSETRKSILLYPQVIAVNMIYLWLNNNVCECMLNNARNVRETLQSFTELRVIELRLSRSLETMAIQCCSVLPKICIGGFYELNHKSGFQAVVVTVFALVILVQYDYNNLY